MATPSPSATKINDLPKFFSFSENAPIAAGAAAATAIPAPNADKPVDKAAEMKPNLELEYLSLNQQLGHLQHLRLKSH